MFGGLEESPRAERLLEVMVNHAEVSVLATSLKHHINGKFFNLYPLNKTLPQKLIRASKLFLGAHESYLKSLYSYDERLEIERFDAVICEDLLLLPRLLETDITDRFIQDLREFYPKEFEHNWIWRKTFGNLMSYICHAHLAKADHCWTVSPGLKEAYMEKFGVKCELYPSYPKKLCDSEPPIKTGTHFKLVHHGVTNPNRNLEIMIEAAASLPQLVTLDLILVNNNPQYYKKLKLLANGLENVRILPPVRRDQLTQELRGYDIGLFCPNPTTFNLEHSWPNKIFEFIQAGLMLLTTPLAGTSIIIRKYKNGMVTQNFGTETLIEALESLSPEKVDNYKNSSMMASNECNFEAIEQNLVNSILGNRDTNH